MRSDKKELRRLIRERKAIHTAEECRAKSEALIQWLERHPRFAQARVVLLYHSLPDEVFTHGLVEEWSQRKEVLLPVVVGDELELRRYTGKEDLRIGAYGIEEPVGELFTDYDRIEVAVIPGVAFDACGNRLGRGKGYYDRLLPRLSTYNIGICYDFQALDEVPHEPFDQRMDAVLTDRGWLFTGK